MRRREGVGVGQSGVRSTFGIQCGLLEVISNREWIVHCTVNGNTYARHAVKIIHNKNKEKFSLCTSHLFVCEMCGNALK